MLTEPPSFIRPLWYALADITGWFNWDALAAIGTVGALWFAVVQFTAAARMRRARQIGTLTTLIGLLEPITESIPQFEGQDGFLTLDEFRSFANAKAIVVRAQEGLERFDSKDVADVSATSWLGALPLVLQEIRDLYPRTLSARVPLHEVNAHVEQLWFATEEFRTQRDFLRYGAIGAAVRKIVFRSGAKSYMRGSSATSFDRNPD